jgi:hypothetical protein
MISRRREGVVGPQTLSRERVLQMTKPEDAKGEGQRPPRGVPAPLRGATCEPIPRSKKERPASKGRVHKGRTGK